MTEIDLDWDNITIEELCKRICKISLYQFVYSIQVLLSPMNGFHVIVTTYNHVPRFLYFKLRHDWKDDGRRLIHDVLFRRGEKHSCIMFKKKIIGNTVWMEENLFTLRRLMKGFHQFNLGYRITSSQLQRSSTLKLHATFVEELEQLLLKEILESWIYRHVLIAGDQEECETLKNYQTR